jgi:hypothetical protein
MVEGQASDLYAFNTDTWSVTSMIQGSAEEPPVDSHSPSGSCSRQELPQVMSGVVSLHHVLMFSILLVSAQCELWDASTPCPQPHPHLLNKD